ncbi:hypothetical protein FJY63_01035 [Candidatus Sumerlaeota bacterium]|nr:hypothetical protein [Candidatus Sumerlaeota bacterium]
MAKGFCSDLRALIRGHRKGLLITCGGCAVVFIAFIGVLAYKSEKPEFCLNCHIMEPYYNSWKASNHKDVNCLVCHFEPGVQGFVRGKVVAFSQFVRYITTTYGSKPWAEIPDTNCLREGCHEGEQLKGPIEYRKGVPFDHSHHLGDTRRGKQLRCTSCHSQIVQGSHMTVTESVCYICHFKPEASGLRNPKMSDCRTCHIRGVSNPLAPDEHALFVERGTDCLKCHFNVIHGSGNVRKQRCESCHADPDHLSQTDSAILHQVHVADHKVECFGCHDEIEHRLETIHEIASADCGLCHAERHQLQKTYYEGTADVPLGSPMPGAMLKAHVACSGCHSEVEQADGATSPTATRTVAHASGKACDHCHGSGYDRLLADWNSEVERRSVQLRGLARIAESVSETTDSAVHAVGDKIRFTLDVIHKVRPVHNIGYSAILIGDCQKALLSATSTTAVGATLRGWLRDELGSYREAPSCLQRCHYEISHKSAYLKNQKRLFSHAPHVNVARLDCGACHSREAHKVSLPRGYDCIGCHHEKARGKQCADCHQDVFELAEKGFAGYDTAASQNLDCNSCHKGTAGEIVLLNRTACRECHADDRAYLEKIERQMDELGRMRADVDNTVQAHWNMLDFQGLQIADRARRLERANGIHNYSAARHFYAAAKKTLAERASTATATAAVVTRNLTRQKKGE